MKMKRPDSCGRIGAAPLLAALRDEIERNHLQGEVTVRPSPCLDCCGEGPVVAIYDGANREFSRPPDGLMGFFTAKPSLESALTPARARALVCEATRTP